MLPTDFDEHSERLFSDYDDEMSRRCAISRGYYYAFHHVRQVGHNHPKGNFSDGYDTHKKAKQFCRQIGDSRLADQLNDLHRRRKQADYDIEDEVEKIDVETFRLDLENFMNDFKMNLSGI